MHPGVVAFASPTIRPCSRYLYVLKNSSTLLQSFSILPRTTQMKVQLLTTIFSTLVFGQETGQFAGLEDYIVSSHNEYRSTELPADLSAANMLEMTWSSDMAKKAEDWAKKCSFSHYTDGYGQNLYTDSGYGTQITRSIVDNFMTNWGANEMITDVPGARAAYQKTGELKGPFQHYSAMVWASTAEVGCAYAICPGEKRIVVCNYFTAGNIQGQPWYTVGPSCSACPADTTCKNGLCSKDAAPAVTTPAPTTKAPTPAPAPVPTSPPVPSVPKQTRTFTSEPAAPTHQGCGYIPSPPKKTPCPKTRRLRS